MCLLLGEPSDWWGRRVSSNPPSSRLGTGDASIFEHGKLGDGGVKFTVNCRNRNVAKRSLSGRAGYMAGTDGGPSSSHQQVVLSLTVSTYYFVV